jgi:hypothetical protein
LNTNQNLTKERRTKIINKRLWIKVEISINERTTLKFRMVNVNFKGKRERKKKEVVGDTLSYKQRHTLPYTKGDASTLLTPSYKLLSER